MSKTVINIVINILFYYMDVIGWLYFFNFIFFNI